MKRKSLSLVAVSVTLSLWAWNPAVAQVEEAWVAALPAEVVPNASAMTVDEVGNVYAVGQATAGGGPEYGTAKMDPDGHQLWAAVYYGTDLTDNADGPYG